MSNERKFWYGEVMQAEEAGEMNFNYINTRIDTAFNSECYCTSMKFSDEYTKKLQDTFAKLLKDKQESEEGKALRWSRNPSEGWTETDDGDILFKMKSKKRDKATGKLQKIPLYDSQLNELDPMINLMTGSKVVPMFQPTVYWTSSKDNGITVYLEGLILVEPKIYTGGAGNKPKMKPIAGGYIAGDTKYETDVDPLGDPEAFPE